MPETFRYRLTGLNLESEFPLPYLMTAQPGPDFVADVTMRSATHAEMGEGWINQLITPNTVPGDILCQPLPELRLRIVGGATVLVHCAGPIPDGELSVYLTGPAWGFICHQRGLLALHCSAVAHDGLAFAFTGPSGAGKSTMLLGLDRRGFAGCCDDLMVVTPGSRPAIHEMASGAKLWDDAVAHFGTEQVADLRVRGERRKYQVSRRQNGEERLVPLGALYLLAETRGPPQIERLTGYPAWIELYRAVYRIDMVPWINSPQALARQIDALARVLPVFRLVRPIGFDHFDEGLDLLEEHMREISGDTHPKEAAE